MRVLNNSVPIAKNSRKTSGNAIERMEAEKSGVVKRNEGGIKKIIMMRSTRVIKPVGKSGESRRLINGKRIFSV